MSEPWAALSERLAALVEENQASIARVEGRRGRSWSAVAWDASTVVTAAHGLRDDDGFTVHLPDGTSTTGTVVGRDETRDVAVLKLAEVAGSLRAPAWGDLDGAKVGHLVLTLGRPGRSARATLGMISALGGAWRTTEGGAVDRYVEVDGSLPPGFSGGFLVDLHGKALGMNSSALGRGGGTIPTATLRKVVDALIAHGGVRRGYLGLGAWPARLPDGLAARVGRGEGLLVVSVEPGGPADTSGVLLGDVILALGGKPVARVHELVATLDEAGVGAELVVTVARGGEAKDVTVRVGARQ